MRRLLVALGAATLLLGAIAGPALACGGLIGPNGAVNLLRTTTFAGYHDGIEHYVTAFNFAGGSGEFGSIIPLPGVPTDVVKGGDWTLQRLALETAPAEDSARVFALPAAGSAQVLLQKKIDALEITVLKGGALEVGTWASEHGFRLPPDAPEVLEFYAQRSPIFLAARFDADAARARGQQVGDGTPIHITIPTPDPWVPLRILALGKGAGEVVEADVFLLTDHRPNILPAPIARGLSLAHSAPASEQLLADLRSDRDMDWVPAAAWLTKVAISAAPGDLTFDLAVDASGSRMPSRVAAGIEIPAAPSPGAPIDLLRLVFAIGVAAAGIVVVLILTTRRETSLAG